VPRGADCVVRFEDTDERRIKTAQTRAIPRK
jgi:glutamyl/glutaminyl-tRNA synthetase